MTLKAVEEAIRLLDIYLEANIAAKIVVLNARYADSTTLGDIKKWYLGSLPIVTPENPSICLHGTGWTALSAGQRKDSLEIANQVDLVIFIGDSVVENRFKKLCRYVIGLLELCQAYEYSSGYSFSIGGQVRMTDAMSTAPFLAGIIVPIIMTKVEDF